LARALLINVNIHIMSHRRFDMKIVRSVKHKLIIFLPIVLSTRVPPNRRRLAFQRFFCAFNLRELRHCRKPMSLSFAIQLECNELQSD
jgi:hypothetical protein